MATHYPQLVYTIEHQINEFFDSVISCVNRRRSALLAKVSDKSREMAARMSELEQKLMAARAEIERTLDSVKSGGFEGRMLAEIGTKFTEAKVPQQETRLVFRGDYEQLEQLMLELGEVEEEMPPAIPRYQELREITAVGKKGRNPGDIYGPKGVAIDTNTNHIYVAEYDIGRVSIFSESGEFLNAFTHEPMKGPWGIAIHRDNVYVTDIGVHGVFQFKKYTEICFIARLTGYGSADGKFANPRQLAVSANGDVFVTDFWNHRIQILDDSLNYEYSITHETMRNPADVKLTDTEVFVLSFNDSPCIHAFTHAGEKIRSFVTRGVGMEVVGAHFICLDAQENIIISDRVIAKVFSPDGTLLHTLEGFSCPGGIALINQSKLVVITPKEKLKLKIYSC